MKENVTEIRKANNNFYLAKKETEKFIVENSKIVDLNSYEITEEVLKNLDTTDVKTIILPTLIYNFFDPPIRNWDSFKESTTREILYLGLFGKWNEINVSVYRMDKVKAIFLCDKTVEEISKFRRERYNQLNNALLV